VTKPPSKPRKARKPAQVPEGSGEAKKAREAPFLAPEQPMAHSRARADTIEAICVHLRRGKPLLVACALERVPRRTFYNWREDEAVDLEIECARAEGSELHRRRLEKHIRAGDSKGANVRLNLMATLYDSYAPPKQRVGLEGGEGSPVAVQHSGGVTLTVDNAVRIARQAKESGK
jgi:hypothetical protein